LKFTPLPDANGNSLITVTVEDGGLDADLATTSDNVTTSASFTVTVRPMQDVPVVTIGSFKPEENKLFTATEETGLAQFASDVDGESLTFTLITAPEHGQLVLAEDGSFTYRPDTNFNRSDTFTFKANDGTDDSNVETVTLAMETAFPWHNSMGPMDVSGDGDIQPMDVLKLINLLGSGNGSLSNTRDEGVVAPFYDVDRDGDVSSSDAMAIVNWINDAWRPTVQVRLVALDTTGERITEVAQGQDFWLAGYIQDVRTDGLGVSSSYVNIGYPSEQVLVAGTPVFRQPYVNLPRANTATAGIVKGIGSTAASVSVAADEYQQFVLPMKATDAGLVTFTSQIADDPDADPIRVFGNNDIVTERQANYGRLTINVLPAGEEGEGESFFELPVLSKTLPSLPASRLSLLDWSGVQKADDGFATAGQFERPSVAHDRLLWQQRVDDVISDLADDDEELFFSEEDWLAEPIEDLLEAR